jgi:ferredoxin
VSLPTPTDLGPCVYCPRLCRHVCPVAVGTGRESASPTAMATQVWLYLEGRAELKEARAAAALCVECGACEAACEVEQPLAHLLGDFRRRLAPHGPQPLSEVEGEGALVAIEVDERRWAEALAARLGQPVARLRTADHLGQDALGQPSMTAHLARLRTSLGARTAVVSEHRSLAVLEAAGIATAHLRDLLDWSAPGIPHQPCAGPRLPGATPAPLALACCGARAALSSAHPALADELAAECGRRLHDEQPSPTAPLCSPDSSCARALRAAGWTVEDPLSSLLLDAQRPSPG